MAPGRSGPFFVAVVVVPVRRYLRSPWNQNPSPYVSRFVDYASAPRWADCAGLAASLDMALAGPFHHLAPFVRKAANDKATAAKAANDKSSPSRSSSSVVYSDTSESAAGLFSAVHTGKAPQRRLADSAEPGADGPAEQRSEEEHLPPRPPRALASAVALRHRSLKSFARLWSYDAQFPPHAHAGLHDYIGGAVHEMPGYAPFKVRTRARRERDGVAEKERG